MRRNDGARRHEALSRLGAVAALLLPGCFELDYLLQAGEGQLDLVCRARSLSSVADNPDIDPRTRALLAEVPRMKAFGVDAGLVATSNYEDFVDLDRTSVMWVVSAAPELSLTPQRWWLPLTGEVTYLGWFDRGMAERHARDLQADGWDVDVRGASAYSTLGFLKDAVLSTMIEHSDYAAGQLANIILHESVHDTVFVPDQSAFNDGLATFLGDQLTVSYLSERFGSESRELTSWRAVEETNARLRNRLLLAHEDLSALYASSRPDAEKRQEKQRYLADLRRELRFSRPISNATLSHYDTYHGAERAMATLLERCGGDVERVVAVAKGITAADFRRKNEDVDVVIERVASRCGGALPEGVGDARPCEQAEHAHRAAAD
jgi:predicted aminopeptidase